MIYDNKKALTHSFMVGYPRILNSEAMPKDTRDQASVFYLK